MNETQSEDTPCPPCIHSNVILVMKNMIGLERIGLGDNGKHDAVNHDQLNDDKLTFAWS